MTPSTVEDFVNFLKLNIDHINNVISSQKRINWKGEECAEMSTIADVRILSLFQKLPSLHFPLEIQFLQS